MLSRRIFLSEWRRLQRQSSKNCCLRGLASAVKRGQSADEIAGKTTFEFKKSGTKTRPQRSDVYSWGFSATGALGNENWVRVHRDEEGNIEMPKRVMKKDPHRMKFVCADTTVHDVAAGGGFTVIAATVKNTPYVLFGCGLNTDSQIGRQDTSLDNPLVCVGNVVPIALPIEVDAGRSGSDHNQIKLDRDEHKREKVIKVAAGRAHTVCLTSLGNVFTLGNNSYGQCGRPIVEGEQYFASRKVHQINIPGVKIVEVVCGQDHTLLLSDSGAVYAFGWGTDGQLGNGQLDLSFTPTPVIGDIQGERIVALSSACDTILALNDKGQVFGWGNSEYGQLESVTKDTQVSVARALNLENVVGKVSSVAAGGSMCSLVNESGAVFVWGFGILGIGPSVTESRTPTQLPPSLFGKSILRTDARVHQVCGGLNHFAAITERGELFMWGRNNKASLGIGTEIDMNFPFRVAIPSKVRKVSLGVDHTIALTRALI